MHRRVRLYPRDPRAPAGRPDRLRCRDSHRFAAPAATAPGRIAFALGGPAPTSGLDVTSPNPGAALPGGSVLTILHDEARGTAAAVKLRRDGSLDPTFGAGGIARIPAVGRVMRFGQAEPLDDGRLLLAGTMRDGGAAFSPTRLVVMRLLANGAPDASFGVDGAAVVSSISGQPGDAPMAVAPDGSILVTGSALVPGETNPLNPGTTDWVVARLTPAGALDAGFGVARIPVGAARRAEGTSVALRQDGSIVVLGRTDATPGGSGQLALAGLTALGAPDAGFNAGAPSVIPLSDARSVRLRENGTLEVAGRYGVSRFTAAGAPDTSFGTNGTLAFTRIVANIVATPDGGALLDLGASSTRCGRPRPPPHRRAHDRRRHARRDDDAGHPVRRWLDIARIGQAERVPGPVAAS